MATRKQVEPEWLRKITVKAVTGGIDDALLKRLVNKPTEAVPLLHLFGIAKATKVKVTDLGESIAFIGEFEARSLIGESQGEEFRSSKCYLPKFLEEDLHGLLGNNPTSPISFAFEIGVKYDKSAATKYVYTAKPLVSPVGGDALALLKAQATGKALPAPKGA